MEKTKQFYEIEKQVFKLEIAKENLEMWKEGAVDCGHEMKKLLKNI